MADFKSTSEYAKLNTLKNRNKNLEIKDDIYKYMDTTGSYVGFKENKKSPVYMCSCSRDGIKKDIEMINRKAKVYDEYDFFDVVWYIGPLVPRDIFKSLDFNMLMEFKDNNRIDVDELLNKIPFKNRICRICKVEDNKHGKISFEEFTELKLFYKHQVMNELNVYSNFGISGGCRRVNYDVNEYRQKKVDDKYEVEVKEIDLYLEDIKKVVPIALEFYDENMELDIRYYTDNKRFYEDRKYFEDMDIALKEKLGYGKSIGRWKREEELYSLIKKIYPKSNIIYQYRPNFLYNSITNGQQSLDIYIQDLNIGVEYQGKQHYEPVEIFGGEEGFLETLRRDKEKYELCKNNGIKIAYIKYNEKFTIDNIKSIIDEVINNDFSEEYIDNI